MIDYNELKTKINLSDDDQRELDELLEIITGEDKENLLGLRNESPDMASVIVENFHKKNEIFKNKDKSAMDELLKQEKEMIDNLPDEEDKK